MGVEGSILTVVFSLFMGIVLYILAKKDGKIYKVRSRASR